MAKFLLAEIIRKEKLSKRKLASLLKIHYPHVFRMFRPGYDPKLSTLEKLARVLKVHMNDLYVDPTKSRKKRR